MPESVHTGVLILHVIGASVIVGGSFLSLIVLIKRRIPRDNLKLIEHIWKLIGPAIGIQLCTGVTLALSEWDEFRSNHLFWTKMVLFVVSGIIGGRILHGKIHAGLAKKHDDISIPGIARWTWAMALITVLIAIFGVLLVEGAES